MEKEQKSKERKVKGIGLMEKEEESVEEIKYILSWAAEEKEGMEGEWEDRWERLKGEMATT